ncbi:MAG: hypothetical protein V1859_11215 [archaeon]
MYLYSNIFGTFVLSQNFEIREKVLFELSEAIMVSDLLENGKVLPSEEKFLAKFKSIENLRQSKDLKKIRKAIEAVDSMAGDFYDTNMVVTKTKVASSVTADILLVQCSNAIDEYAKASNLLVKRLREWYSFYYPEASEYIDDNESFVLTIIEKSRETLKREQRVKLSMGGKLTDEDVDAIIVMAKSVAAMYEAKKSEELYLENMMKKVCPNLNYVAGTMIGAKLLSIAGTMKKLVLFPSSTIQLLGAEKALFRHLVNRRALPPKHGILHEHKLLLGSPRKNHGKIARALADKISLAVRIDYFKGEFRGDLLKKELEERVAAINNGK